jgi:hypothetical protein
MSKPGERDPNLILLVSVGYPIATALMMFAAWASFWTPGARVAALTAVTMGAAPDRSQQPTNDR